MVSVREDLVLPAAFLTIGADQTLMSFLTLRETGGQVAVLY